MCHAYYIYTLKLVAEIRIHSPISPDCSTGTIVLTLSPYTRDCLQQHTKNEKSFKHRWELFSWLVRKFAYLLCVGWVPGTGDTDRTSTSLPSILQPYPFALITSHSPRSIGTSKTRRDSLIDHGRAAVPVCTVCQVHYSTAGSDVNSG